jgi:hypothetical protein
VSASPASRKIRAGRVTPHWLYRMFDTGGHLLYVGQTRHPANRLAWWRTMARPGGPAPWFHTVTRVQWRRFPDWWAVSAAEREAIVSERPLHNVKMQAPA